MNVGVVGLVGVGLAAGFHPLAPFVVGPEGEGKDEEGEDGEEELHKTGIRGQDLPAQHYAACFIGEDSLRRVRRARPANQKRKSRRRAVSMKPAVKRTAE